MTAIFRYLINCWYDAHNSVLRKRMGFEVKNYSEKARIR